MSRIEANLIRYGRRQRLRDIVAKMRNVGEREREVIAEREWRFGWFTHKQLCTEK